MHITDGFVLKIAFIKVGSTCSECGKLVSFAVTLGNLEIHIPLSIITRKLSVTWFCNVCNEPLRYVCEATRLTFDEVYSEK